MGSHPGRRIATRPVAAVLAGVVSLMWSCSEPALDPDPATSVSWAVDTLRTVVPYVPNEMVLKGRAHDDVYLVMRDIPTLGILYHFDGTTWSRQSLADAGVQFSDVVAIGPGVAFASGYTAGGTGRIYVRENGAWVPDNLPLDAPPVYSISGVRQDSLVAAGSGGVVFERTIDARRNEPTWSTRDLGQYYVSVSPRPSARVHAMASLSSTQTVMTYHDWYENGSGGYPVTRLLTWNGWWWSEVTSVWGEHIPRIVMPARDHFAWVTRDYSQFRLNVLDHGNWSERTQNAGGPACDVGGTSLEDVLVLTESRLFRMNEGHDVVIRGPWPAEVRLAAVWTNGPVIVVAGRSIEDHQMVLVYRGVRTYW